jgi:hypothetical protein
VTDEGHIRESGTRFSKLDALKETEDLLNDRVVIANANPGQLVPLPG